MSRIRMAVAAVGVSLMSFTVVGCGKGEAKKVDLESALATTAPVTAMDSPSPTTAASVTTTASNTTTAPVGDIKGAPKGWKPAATREDQEIFDTIQRYFDIMFNATKDPKTYKTKLSEVASQSVVQEVYANTNERNMSKGFSFQGSIKMYPFMHQREQAYVVVRYCSDSAGLARHHKDGRAPEAGRQEPEMGEAIVRKLDGKWQVQGTAPAKGGACEW